MTYSNHCSKETAYSCQSFKANLSILWLIFWPMPYQYTLSQDLQQSSTEYIEQVSLEANLVARLLEITQEKFNTTTHPEQFWEKTYPLGNPNPKSSSAWFNPKNLVFLHNAYVSLLHGKIAVFVDFKDLAYVHPDLANSSVVFYAIDKEGKYIQKSSFLSNEAQPKISSFTCNINQDSYPKNKKFAQLQTSYAPPINIAGQLPFPFSKCHS